MILTFDLSLKMCHIDPGQLRQRLAPWRFWDVGGCQAGSLLAIDHDLLGDAAFAHANPLVGALKLSKARNETKS